MSRPSSNRSKQLAEERDRKAKLAAVEERTRIAREMHDIVSHSLAVVVTLAEGAHATDSLDRARQANRAIADTARASLDQMRIMLGVLRDDGTDEPPLAPTLDTSPDELVETARAAGVPVTLTVSGTPHDGDMQRLAVRRIVQESLTNAMRYAPNATAVSVTIAYSSDTATVEVVNDGVHETRDSQGSGLGLQGLAGARGCRRRRLLGWPTRQQHVACSCHPAQGATQCLKQSRSPSSTTSP